MSLFQRSFLIRTSALAALTLGCTAPMMTGCGGGDDEEVPGEETGGDSDIDTSVVVDSAKPDGGADTTDTLKADTPDTAVPPDTLKADTPDTADTLKADTPDTADTLTPTDTADTATPTDTADTATPTDTLEAAVDTLMPDTLCTPGTACGTGKVCNSSGICGDCTTDAECSAATAGTLCFSGTCLTATCHPTKDTTCTGTDAVNCCANATSAGACVSAGAGKTTCCADADCAGLTGTVSCDTTTNTCVCPAPAPGALFVTATGSDTTGNGSASCPFATITKAIGTLSAAPPAVASTVTVGAGTYGSGCTNAGGCDATQIAIPATITAGITIKGDGGVDAVKVVGSATATWVFNSSAPATSFANMTVQATNNGATPGGGIRVNAAAATTEGSISNVKVVGIGGVTPTNDGIRVLGGASPQIGPGVAITGGANGINVTDSATVGSTASHPTLLSAAGAQTSITGTGTNCVRVFSASAQLPTIGIGSSDAATPVHLADCAAATGGAGILVNEGGPAANGFARLLIDRTSVVGFTGILIQGASTVSLGEDTVSGVGGTGIRAEGTSGLTIGGLVTSSGNTRGVYITGNATATISGLTATGSIGAVDSDGLRCDSIGFVPGSGITVKVRNSTFLSNQGSGVFVSAPGGVAGAGCTADLGSAADSGSNVYNKTATRNTRVGLCYVSTSAPTSTPFTSTWSCGAASGSGCTSGAPTNVANCTLPGDYAVRLAGSLINGNLSVPLGQTCCGS